MWDISFRSVMWCLIQHEHLPDLDGVSDQLSATTFDWIIITSPEAALVNEVKGEDVICLIKNSATLSGSLFTLHVSQICIELPTLTDKDKEVISTLGVRNKIFAKIENCEVGCPHFSSCM
ncbi:unnamed protein product [Lactuca virosa]|uniref:Uncharacterized protein n=1 Tax=Lactuca virosa TaxID=75947 RepID=A0AAU9NKS2_9ASTR|nr:unnamed protein product [Lactuca virosa]